MSYVTVFEITREAIPLWIPFFPIIFGLIGTVILLLSRGSGPVAHKYLARFFVFAFACLWVIFACCYFLGQKRILEAYRSGKYTTIEGVVEHYSWVGKHECFSVRGVEFCHGTANVVGWNPPLRLGPATWPIGLAHDGLPVRVAYCKEEFPMILRLEIGRNSR